jgi:hypothetical protein
LLKIIAYSISPLSILLIILWYISISWLTVESFGRKTDWHFDNILFVFI